MSKPVPMVNENGVIRPMTLAEQAEYERLTAEMAQMQPEQMPEERIAALEAALAVNSLIMAELITTTN